MLASPFTFYRGAAALMAEDLAPAPQTGLAVQLCGDAHLSNFGVFAAPDRRLRMSELGARAVLSRERISRVVDELERAGMVRREHNPDDGRSLLAAITGEGRTRIRAAAPTYLAGIERHFGAHVGDDAGAVAAALERVVEATGQQRAQRRGRPVHR